MFLICVVVAYLLGSVSSSTLVARWVGRIDIRQHGSGNAGATNTLRVLGVKWAIVVLLFDIIKGILSVLIAQWLMPGNHVAAFLAGLAAVIGHNWPIFFGFRGGKGIATTIGVLFLLMFTPAILAGLIAIALLVTTRYVSLAALTFTILTPVFAIALPPHPHTPHWMSVGFGVLIAILSIYRHRSNLGRLVKGREHRIFSNRL